MIRVLFGLVFGLIASAPADQVRREWDVDGVTRVALLDVPGSAKTEPTPVVFVFHGHGGTMQSAHRAFGIRKEWPEAMEVCMQGLNTPGRLTDPDGKRPGWQSAMGDQGDRDLKFFDAVLQSLRKDYRVDETRVFATGHSNGGSFTYVLWAARRGEFAAFAPSSAPATRSLRELKPAPALHLAGENDELVKFAWQQPTMAALRKLNGTGDGKPWHDIKWATLYPSEQGNDVVTFIHPGTHRFPSQAPAAIVRFFKEHPRRSK